MEEILLTAAEKDIGTRLDVFIADGCDITRSAAEHLIADGNITVDGVAEKVKKNMKIPAAGFEVKVTMPAPSEIETEPEDIPLDIVYEDDDIIVINKEKGMVVHPAPGNERGTLVNALLYHCAGSLSGINGVKRPGIVHRIDKDTSGLLVCAKNDRAHTVLSDMLKSHDIKREYVALCYGRIKEESGTVEGYIGRDIRDRKKRAVTSPDAPDARHAVTHYKVIGNFGNICYCSFTLETGRTHQIRVHMKSISHPIIGDALYGGDKNEFYREHRKLISGQCLHAEKISFAHPVTGEKMQFTAPLPEYFERLLEIIKSEE